MRTKYLLGIFSVFVVVFTMLLMTLIFFPLYPEYEYSIDDASIYHSSEIKRYRIDNILGTPKDESSLIDVKMSEVDEYSEEVYGTFTMQVPASLCESFEWNEGEEFQTTVYVLHLTTPNHNRYFFNRDNTTYNFSMYRYNFLEENDFTQEEIEEIFTKLTKVYARFDSTMQKTGSTTPVFVQDFSKYAYDYSFRFGAE